MNPRIPEITHLQFLVLSVLTTSELSGQMLRHGIEACDMAGPKFYQMMARMEDSNLVVGRMEKTSHAKGAYRRRFYKATKTGLSQLANAKEFYK